MVKPLQQVLQLAFFIRGTGSMITKEKCGGLPCFSFAFIWFTDNEYSAPGAWGTLLRLTLWIIRSVKAVGDGVPSAGPVHLELQRNTLPYNCLTWQLLLLGDRSPGADTACCALQLGTHLLCSPYVSEIKLMSNGPLRRRWRSLATACCTLHFYTTL